MLPEGTLLGRYRVDALAAVGGMGAVYRGTDTLLERAVALKVLPADRAGDEGMAKRFADESLQAASLSHPHVLPVYDAGEAAGVSYVAMQWVDGATLEQLIVDEGPLDLDRAADVTDAVAGALDHAHQHGLVHRDVKPGNVMGDGDGDAYLMDFGLSVRADRTSAATRTGEFLATVDYAAPEQIEGIEVDHRADVYGLAGLAFRCLTGRVPFERDSPVARLYAHLNDEPPAAHELRPAVPPAVSETIRRGLAKRPEDRPQSAGAFAAELRAALGNAPEHTMPLAVMAAEPEAAEAAAPAARRTRRILAGAAATVLAAFGGMSLAGITGGGTPSGDLPAADAGQRESRDAKTAKATTPAASAPTPAGTDGPQADKAKAGAKKKKGKKGEKDRGELRSEADGGLSGAGAGPDVPSSAPGPSAAPAAPQTSSPGGTAPTGGGTQMTQSQPSGTETTSTQPTETTPAQTTPSETTPSEPPPAETRPTETTPSG